MKLFEQPEPGLRYAINDKKARRKSQRWIKKARNRAIRNHLKINLEVGKEILNRAYGWEF